MSDSELNDTPLYIVGIGASAGGLAALEQFFDHMPADSGMAFVIVQHLSPDFKSQMGELLRRHTGMPIQKVAHNIALRPNNIYLNISMTLMEVRAGHLLLTQIPEDRRVELPIDVFFTSLSNEVGTRAIGVILSGTGRDGSLGVRSIHGNGGMVAVQSPDSAQFDAMPQSAIDTGACDFILPAEEIPAALMESIGEPALPSAENAGGSVSPATAAQYREIFGLLQRACHLDFANYKKGTVGRRIRRRMGYRQLESLPEYTSLLASDQNELDELYHDLLIGVTEFFRDEKAFRHLESVVIPELFAALAPGRDMRAWSAGCATGEEAYSLAILLAEQASRRDFTGKISVFATDVHKRSLDSAAQGIFTADRLANLSPERLERYFTEVDKNVFKVKSELRKLLTFAHHDLTREIPFSKLDLICCRNLLIYLQPETQKKVLSLLHFALNMNGVLFLGKSEGIGPLAGHFETLSGPEKIFRKIKDHKLAEYRVPDYKGSTPVTPGRAAQPALQRAAAIDRRVLYDYDALLERHIPPGVLVDENFQVIHYFGEVAQFLKTFKGRAETDILSMTEGHLHVALSTSLHRVKKNGLSVIIRDIGIRTRKDQFRVDVVVDPVPYENAASLHYHVYFQRIREAQPPATERPMVSDLGAFDPSLYYRQHLADLELELQDTKAELLSTRETLQSTSEALNATNEELQAANEELQATNEELNSAQQFPVKCS